MDFQCQHRTWRATGSGSTLLVECGLAPTRAKAQALVLAGAVTVDGRAADKPGRLVDRGAELAVIEPTHPASRGGVSYRGARGVRFVA
jgi:23S rRNA (cytidine1920-2'-O)/16S rRNA (cytidine1409-2'-O)-methyltransferase